MSHQPTAKTTKNLCALFKAKNQIEIIIMGNFFHQFSPDLYGYNVWIKHLCGVQRQISTVWQEFSHAKPQRFLYGTLQNVYSIIQYVWLLRIPNDIYSILKRAVILTGLWVYCVAEDCSTVRKVVNAHVNPCILEQVTCVNYLLPTEHKNNLLWDMN